MACQGGSFRPDSLHQAAVSDHGVDVVVEDGKAGLVVAGGEPLAGDGHSHAGRGALPERAGRGLDAGDPVVLGVPGRLAPDLAEPADVLERHRRLPEPLVFGVHRFGPAQMQHRPEQHRGVTVGEDEPIAVRPDRIVRIEAHHAVPHRVDEGRQRHRCAGMARLRLLDRVDRERADGVDRQFVEVYVGHPFGGIGSVHGFVLVNWLSSVATLRRRRKCRGDWLNSAERNVCTRSQATSGPTVRPPMQMTFM